MTRALAQRLPRPRRSAQWGALATVLMLGACDGTVASSDPGRGVGVVPSSATLPPGGSRLFEAAVTGSAVTSVTWSVEPVGAGSVTAQGLYTAPATQGTYRVLATTVADPQRSGFATVTVQQGKPAPSLPWLSVSGNKIVDPHGNTVVLRGASLIDLGAQHVWNGGIPKAIDMVTGPGWYTRIVRLPVYPPLVESYASPRPWPFETAGNEAYLTELLVPAIDYATSKGLYVIVDFHQIGDTAGAFDTQAREFWRYVAPRFRDRSNVLYEVFNEPIDDISTDPDVRWDAYRPRAQGWVDVVRAAAPNNLILVGSPIWSQNLGPAATRPIVGDNIVYVAHPYPANWNSWLQGQISSCAAVHPVITTEWGYNAGEGAFGTSFKSFAEQQGLSWTAWCVNDAWGPPMFNANGTPNAFGTFVKNWLTEKQASDQPQP